MKNNSGINIILLFSTIILAILCVLFATDIISFNGENKCLDGNKNIDGTHDEKNNKVIGTYTTKFENLKGEGDVNSASATLNLYENGVFTYIFNQYAPTGVLGNYIIEGDKIILTNWFNSDSGTGLHITKGSKILIINSDGSITDNNIRNKPLVDNNITTANLVKGVSQSPIDLSNRLGAAFFTSSDHTVSEPSM